MLKRVWKYIERHRMIGPGDRVAVGVSGGADSVCLALILTALSKEQDFFLEVIHVEHGYRGEESLEDARFVENLCKRLGLPLRMFHVDMERKARAEGLSLEEAGRALRYECFDRVCREDGVTKIALAHHRDDQSETVLHHLFRGSGLRGLCGMAPVREQKDSGGILIRPLLEVNRKEIEAWLLENEEPWCVDRTNDEACFTRNKLRLQVLPLVEKEIQPRAGEHVARTAEYLREVQKYLDCKAEEAYAACVDQRETEENEVRICLPRFLELETLMRTMVLQRGLVEMNRGLKDISAVHLQELHDLTLGETGKMVCLPRGIRARREYEWLILQEEVSKCEEPTAFWEVQVPGTYVCGGVQWHFSLENLPKSEIIPEKTYTKWFDYDKIEQHLTIRTRRPGDFLEINQNFGRKKLKDYFIDCKVSREDRERLLLLADGAHILWVPGLRISEGYKVTEQTKRLLKVEMVGGT